MDSIERLVLEMDAEEFAQDYLLLEKWAHDQVSDALAGIKEVAFV